MKKLALIYLLWMGGLCPSIYLFGQIAWQRNYGNSMNFFPISAIELGNGHYIVVGESNYTVMVKELNEYGDVLKSNTFWTGNYDFPSSMIKNGNELAIIGNVVWGDPNNPTLSTYLLRLDTALNLIDQHLYTGYELGDTVVYERSFCITALKNGGYAMAGAKIEQDYIVPNVLNTQINLRKVDAQGNEKWVKFFGYVAADQANGIIEDEEGNLVVAGLQSIVQNCDTNNSGMESKIYPFILKTDSSGNELWQTTLLDMPPNNGLSCAAGQFSDMLLTHDGNYIFMGHAWGPAIAYKMNKNGSLIWKASNFGGKKVKQAPNGDLYFCTGGGMSKTTADGTVIWQKIFDVDSKDFIITNDGGLLMVGTGIFTDYDSARIIKTDCEGNIENPVTCVLNTTSVSWAKDLKIYPNPMQTQFTVETSQAIKRLILIEVTGKAVWQISNPSQPTFEMANLPKGLYFLTIETEKGAITQKIMKE